MGKILYGVYVILAAVAVYAMQSLHLSIEQDAVDVAVQAKNETLQRAAK